MKASPVSSLPRILGGAIAVLLFGAPVVSVSAATFIWGTTSGSFADPTKWQGGLAPTGLDATDVLTFGGDVGTVAAPAAYIATSDSLVNPFLINQLNFLATTTTPGSGPVQTITGTTPLLLGGTNPRISQNGTASIVIDVPIKLGATTTFEGATVVPDVNLDKATITLNGAISGAQDIVKNGTSTFRFGSVGTTAPSLNTWFGGLTINGGTIRFNNNAYTASTALRSNPVTLTSATSLLTTLFKPLGSASGQDPQSSLRFGTLSGSAGTVEGRRESLVAGAFDSIDMTITALTSGTFSGTLRNTPTGAGDDSGKLVVRGVATQTLAGTLNISKDVEVGDTSTLVLSSGASLGAQASGAVIIAGGTFRLDNTAVNNGNRLRNGNSDSTGLETIGGGTFSLVGNSAGTTESASRVQLGSAANSRSGALTINVTHTATAGATVLNFESYSRDVAGNPLNTVNFTATDASGAFLPLGSSGNNPRITFIQNLGTPFSVPLYGTLLGNTGAADQTTVGWATVNGADFASYGVNGIVRVDSLPPPVGTSTGGIANHANVTGNLSLTNAGGYSLGSLKMAPSASGQAIDIATAGFLRTTGYLLAGTTDFTINASGTGGIGALGSAGPRYFHITSAMLTVNARVNGAQAPIVKSGAGTLVLTNTANSTVTQPVVLNEGTLRATPGTSLPNGELRFRGGVLEITGGGTFMRQVGAGSTRLNWNGIDTLGAPISQERGSGGFAAIGANVTVDLAPLTGTEFAWEDDGFVNSGYSLIFGSTRADARLTWVDNINLSSVAQAINYNARQVRVIDNPSSTADVAVLSGNITGTLQNDLLKSGDGELILSSAGNTYTAATLVTEGTLRVNGSTASSFLTNVSSSATLGGGGTVGNVRVDGSLAPGDFAGNTSILNTADLAFTGSGARLAIELGGTTAGGNNTSGYDRVNATGGISLAGSQLQGSLLNGFTPALSDLFFIIVNNGVAAVQGTFAQGSSVVIGTQLFNISYTGNFTGTASNSFTGGNDVVLQLAIPEPATGALALFGLAALGARRRRRA